MTKIRFFAALRTTFVIILAFLIALPFADRFHIADWSAFDRTYKLWDEVFTLPIPSNATLVGNWGQLNAMRYMQRIEHRRTDLQLVGTLYDTTPQTQATQFALADGRAIFLAPSVAQPDGDYRYAMLGPLLQVYDNPRTQASANAKNIAIDSSLTLANYGITTALEPFAPTTSIAPNRTARVSLTWLANDTPKNFIVRINLYDPDARLIARKDEAPVRGLYPASQWQRGEYVSDVHNFLIPAGSPPGTYQLKMQTIDAETKKSASDQIMLASLIIERATNLTRDQVFIQHPIELQMNPNVTLWGYGGVDGDYHATDKVTLNLVWYINNNAFIAYKPPFFMLYLLGPAPSYRMITSWKWDKPISFYPVEEWQKGEALKSYYDLQLPDSLVPGEYYIGVLYYYGGSDPVTIGKIQIAP